MECMARPRSEDKRDAIMAAAIKVIAAQGLSAPTALIAKEAGVSNGSLFTYFETKADLFNQLYLDLKAGMASAALGGLPARAELRKQVFHTWSNWTTWAVSNPEKRRALAQLGVSDEITPASRAAGHKTMAGIAELMQRSRANGPMRDAPMEFVAEIMNSLAEATMDYMVRDPTNAKKHCKIGFDAFWRAIA
jgi:AcrR family transcriptional regulator